MSAHTHRVTVCCLAVLGAMALLLGCASKTAQHATTVITTVTTPLDQTRPGTGKPTVVVGDKNFTEQFVLGALYYLALKAQGYDVTLDRNIGPTDVTIQALQTGSLSIYPEYLNVWNRTVAGLPTQFTSSVSAFRAGQRYALAHGLELLNPSPFSDTSALAVTRAYGQANGLSTIGDLRGVAPMLTIGGPPQFRSHSDGLPAITRAYGVIPAAFKGLEIGEQYQALEQGTVQVADVNTTDGQLTSGAYTLLSDPLHVFGYGNVAPVVPLKVIAAEGPQFAATINRVTALLNLRTIRQLNADVDLYNQDPEAVARRFLTQHGLIVAGAG